MAAFKEILPENINENIFSLIGKDWMLISASNGEKTNAMTASWGGAGVLWNKNVAYCFIRPQRFTKGFADSAAYFTLSFFDESYREKLNYFGSVSGRDEDKIAKTGLSVEGLNMGDGDKTAHCFREARLSLVCKKLYSAPLLEEGFSDKTLVAKNYPLDDFHTMYVGEIVRVLSK